jgi:hypothetical protein
MTRRIRADYMSDYRVGGRVSEETPGGALKVVNPLDQSPASPASVLGGSCPYRRLHRTRGGVK